jgi:2-polyprenyl-3-methyl-5-hydroxy-6-metoxy-1,4-benzoquinol methylase
MFLSRRATQAEYFDSPERSFAEVAESYRCLALINRLFYFTEPFQRFIPRILGAEKCRSLTLLDLGAGDGSLGAGLERWAAKRNWSWKVTNLDCNPHALQLCKNGRTVAGSVLELPFENESFDVVIANQMTHHLASDEEIAQHFREALRVSRQAILLSDMQRNAFLYGIIWMVLHAGMFPKHFRDDGLLSVKRGFRVDDWRALANRAGIHNAKVWNYFGARVMLSATKEKSLAGVAI